jgi:hypothetical protein
MRSKQFMRAKRVEMVQHAAVALTMFAMGFEKLVGGDAHLLAYLEVLAGLAVLVSSIIEFKKSDEHTHASVDWPLIFAAGVAVLEGVHRRELGAKYLPYAYWFVAILVFLKGIYHARLVNLRRIEISESGILIRRAPWKKKRYSWSELSSVAADGMSVKFVPKSGSPYLLDLNELLNGEAVKQKFLAAIATKPEWAAIVASGKHEGA